MPKPPIAPAAMVALQPARPRLSPARRLLRFVTTYLIILSLVIPYVLVVGLLALARRLPRSKGAGGNATAASVALPPPAKEQGGRRTVSA